VHAERRAPRPAEQDDLVGVEAASEILRDLVAITRHALDREAGIDRSSRGPERSPGAGLIPLHDDEVLFPRKERGGETRDRRAGAAMQHEDDGVVAILPPDRDPLFRAADVDEHAFVDSVR
jgi:hypothetical protein